MISVEKMEHTTLPRRFYTDPDFYRAELDRFYFNRWICAGRASAIPRSGDYFTRSIGDESIIVTRSGSGEVHALFNVCRHRGTRLCDNAEGHLAERIQCPYHNWTYDLEGRLLAAPHMAPAARSGTATSSSTWGQPDLPCPPHLPWKTPRPSCAIN
jgi:glycine betaine catabolism A